MCGTRSWFPLLIAGAFLYWSVALGLGSLSLSFLASPEHACSGQSPSGADEPIMVRIQGEAPAGSTAAPPVAAPPVAAPPVKDPIGRTAY